MSAYEAAIDYLARRVDVGTSGRWMLTDEDVHALAAAVAAASRAQVAAEIRAVDVQRIADLEGDTARVGLTVAARIAEGGTEHG